ncbi:hypothetical protein MRS44_013980 [Fusarium solani]|uniref:uncharacterized protein n=1 Tax=Fusarium solani TaxID=169388 RepID=UPI0032C4A6B6|nr:hypothetical protein MRS44_013980 [Fusarium solani]
MSPSEDFSKKPAEKKENGVDPMKDQDDTSKQGESSNESNQAFDVIKVMEPLDEKNKLGLLLSAEDLPPEFIFAPFFSVQHNLEPTGLLLSIEDLPLKLIFAPSS